MATSSSARPTPGPPYAWCAVPAVGGRSGPHDPIWSYGRMRWRDRACRPERRRGAYRRIPEHASSNASGDRARLRHGDRTGRHRLKDGGRFDLHARRDVDVAGVDLGCLGGNVARWPRSSLWNFFHKLYVVIVPQSRLRRVPCHHLPLPRLLMQQRQHLAPIAARCPGSRCRRCRLSETTNSVSDPFRRHSRYCGTMPARAQAR